MARHGAQQEFLRFEAIAGKQERHEKGMHLIERSEAAVQEFADCSTEQRLPVTRKTDDCRRNSGLQKAVAQTAGLRPFARAIDAFEIDQHGVRLWAGPPVPLRRWEQPANR